MGSLGVEVVARKPMWIYPKMVGFSPSERWGHSACYSNGLVYVFGGCFGGLHFSDVLVLNLETMTWSALVTKGCGPGPRDSHTAVMWGNKKMVVFGGTNGFKKVNDVHILDLVSHEWTRVMCKGDPPSPRESHTATLISDHKVVVFGGSGEGVGNYLNDLYLLDLKTMTWSSPVVKGDHIPSPRDSHVCVGVGDGLFLFGGDSGDRYHGEVERLDLHNMSWSKLAIEGCSPGARAGHAAVGIGSKIYVIGGVGDKKYYNDAWRLDTETNSWSKLDVCGGGKAASPQGRFSHAAVVAANSDIAIYGGCGEDERPLRELLVLQLGTGNTYVVDGGVNISSSPCKSSLERNNNEHQQQHRQLGRRRIHLGEEKSLHKKTLILGIEVEAAADQKRENCEQPPQMVVNRKRRRTATATATATAINNNNNSNNTTSWEVSEPEEHSHSLSLSSQHSSPSQSDQEQQHQRTTKIAKSSPPTTSHQAAAVVPSPPLLFPFLNQPTNKCNQHQHQHQHHQSRRNALLPNNNAASVAGTIHAPSVKAMPQLQSQSGSCHQEVVNLPPATEERRLQSLIGAEVQGKVDGAFDSGYLMTAVVNGRIFRGVLFSPVPNVVYRRGDQNLSSYNGGGNSSRQQHHHHHQQPPQQHTPYTAERGPASCGLINKPPPPSNSNSVQQQPSKFVDSGCNNNGFGFSRARMNSSSSNNTSSAMQPMSSFLLGEKQKEKEMMIPNRGDSLRQSSNSKNSDLQGVLLTLGGPGAGSG